MGQFQSGIWIISLLFYFAIFYTICYCITSDTGFDSTNIQFTDTGFMGKTQPGSTVGEINTTTVSSSTAGMSNVWQAISMMTGINSNSVNIGTPTAWKWLFSLFFFYVPFLMLLWAGYMALPWVH